jgi:AAA domain
MPSLTAHQSNDYVKLLLCGDSGSGKSGALASLVAAGYHLRILDMDNGLDSLKTFVMKDCPHLADNVEFRTLRDDYKITATGPQVSKPHAFVDALKMLDNWKYITDSGEAIDFGKPSEWGPDVICVMDSLSFFSDAAFDHAKGLNPTAKDPRQWFYSAQQGVESALAMLTSGSFKTNVIITAHVRYSQNDDGTTKGYPNAIGSALGPTIPRYFNHWAQCVSKAGKRSIQTAATNMMDLKNTKPFEMKSTYDLSTGLADFFAVLRDPPKIEKPKSLTLKRI